MYFAYCTRLLCLNYENDTLRNRSTIIYPVLKIRGNREKPNDRPVIYNTTRCRFLNSILNLSSYLWCRSKSVLRI